MKKRIASFKYACKGVRCVAASQVNFRIHLAAAAAAVLLGFYLRISRGEWLAVLLCFAVVLSAEIFNSAIEKMVDFVSPQFHVRAGEIKDIAAGAVLVAAVMAALIGCIIFLPKLAARLY